MTANVPIGLTDYSRLRKTVFRRNCIRNLKTLVVGAGALGNEVAKSLGLLGVGTMFLVDPDKVEASNLTRSIFFRSRDIVGSNKAKALAKAVAKFFPDTKATAIDKEITDVGFQQIREADVIFSCVDSDLARVEIAYISTKLDLPVADGGLGKSNYSHGRISYFPGKSTACYSCMLTEHRRRELLVLWDSSSQSCWAGRVDVRNRAFPSTPTMAAAVGAMQVELGLRRVLSDGQDGHGKSTTVELSLHPVPKLRMFSIARSRTCPFHHHDGRLIATNRTDSDVTVKELLDLVECGLHQEPVLELDWPVCSLARCSHCKFRWSPMERLATLRRRGRCPRCDGARIVAQEVVRCVDRSHPWANRKLADIGLPGRHLYTVKFTPDEGV